MKKFLCPWRMTSKLSWFYHLNLVGDLCFHDGKIWINILCCTIFILLSKSFIIPSLLFPVRSVRLHSLKSMNKLKISEYSQENTCIRVSFNKVAERDSNTGVFLWIFRPATLLKRDSDAENLDTLIWECISLILIHNKSNQICNSSFLMKSVI